MAEKPILFNGDMVRAILNGRKTQTRRIIKNMPETWHRGNGAFGKNPHGDEDFVIHGECGENEIHCQYYPGDLLWVRETFQPLLAAGIEITDYDKYDYKTGKGYDVNYVADGKIVEWIDGDDEIGQRCIPSIHMPKWACRLWLKVQSVRVERVQEISRSDATAEGCQELSDDVGWYGPEVQFCTLWDSINAKRGYGWDTNPWVWAIEFERAEKESKT